MAVPILRRLKSELAILRNALQFRLLATSAAARDAATAFHHLFYDAGLVGGTWGNTFWFGTPVLKCPLDLWLYQEIMHRTAPDLIVETGTAAGGSAHYLACLCDLLGRGRVVTIDIDAVSPRRGIAGRPVHPRITYLTGSSTSEGILTRVRELARGAERVMVILDSDHSRDHVLAEMRAYAPLVTSGNYLIVEDSNVNGHPVSPEFGPGPMEAIEAFLNEATGFTADRTQEKYFHTHNPSGYLLKR